MKRINLLLIVLILPIFTARAQQKVDTLFVSEKYTTHLIYSNEVTYLNLSATKDAAAKIVEQSRNKVAIKAFTNIMKPFSMFIEESNGVSHSYIVIYKENPQRLIVDQRPGTRSLSTMDTISITQQFTTHLSFETDIVYADISAPGIIGGHFADASKSKLAIRAKKDFTGTLASISVEEANGIFRTFIIRYEESPSTLTYKYGQAKDNNSVYATAIGRRRDAPTLKSVMEKPQSLYHISTKDYKIRFTCENIYSYSDIIYFVLRCDNNSQISFECGDAIFVRETNAGAKRMVTSEVSMISKSRFGTLTAPARSESRMAYSFNKFTLSDDQTLKIYLYEDGGGRNLVLTLSPKDINNATTPR